MAFPNIYALQDKRWNNAGTIFNAINLDINNGAGGAASFAVSSRLLKFTNNGQEVFAIGYEPANPSAPAISITRDVGFPGTIQDTGFGQLGIGGANGTLLYVSASHVQSTSGVFSFGPVFGIPDLLLVRDAANIMAQRNGTNAQEFRIYETTDSPPTNYSRLKISYDPGSFCYLVLTQAAGTGTVRSLNLGCGNISADGQWQINSTAGHLFAKIDNTYDIGASGANRPRNIYAAGSFIANGTAVGKYVLSGSSVGGTSSGTGGTIYLAYNVVNNKQIMFGDPDYLSTSNPSFVRYIFVGGNNQIDASDGNANSALLNVGNASFGMGVAGPGGSSILICDAAAVLALRNTVTGATAQTFRIYNTADNGGTNPTNYERLSMGYDSGNTRFLIQVENGGTGAARPLSINAGNNALTMQTSSGDITLLALGGNNLKFYTNNTQRWSVNSSGNFITGTDNTVDIGASGGNRPRNLYVASQMQIWGNNLASSRGVMIGALGVADISMGFDIRVSWSTSNNPGSTQDVFLYRDAAVNTLGLGSGTSPMTFRIYNTTDQTGGNTAPTNYERLGINWATNVCTITTEAGGTGTVRGLNISGSYFSLGNVGGTTYLDSAQGFSIKVSGNATYLQSHSDGAINGSSNYIKSSDGNPIEFGTNNTARWTIDASGNLSGKTAATWFSQIAVTVASLPSAATATKGAHLFVSDATATTFNTTVAGGGGNNVPVFSDGTQWRIG